MATLGKIYDRVNEQVRDLSAQLAVNGLAGQSGQGRVWMLGSPGQWSGDPLDIDGITAAFDRDEPGSDYEQALKQEDPATVGVLLAIRAQSDYLAAAERAFRTRHATLVRSELFGAGSQSGQGGGGLTKTTMKYFQDLVKAGQR